MEGFRDVVSAAARHVDSELFLIEAEIDWLHMVSPTKNDARWETFKNSGYKEVTPLTYPEVTMDFEGIRTRLNSMAMDKIERSSIYALLNEKKEELCLLVDLVENRERDGFLSTSISLFGGSRPTLLEQAKNILETVPEGHSKEDIAKVDDLAQAAEKIRAKYKAIKPDFNFEIKIVEDLSSMMMVNHGDLYLAKSLHVPASRVVPLIAHEVEVHVITRYNGRQQPLHQLESGLAYYDSLQEGLASISEYLTGNLPGYRLRTLAARVVAADMAVKGEDIKSIFERLYEEYDFDDEDAFDTAVRAKRGGGFTKDAVYLEGLSELLSHIHAGENLDMFFLGKFALDQREILWKLVKEGLVKPPALVPEFVTSSEGRKLVEKLREVPLNKLYH